MNGLIPWLVCLAGLMVSVTPFAAGAAAGDAAAGAAAWTQAYAQTDGSPQRSCVSCHGRDLTAPGRHTVTGKPIEPLAPSVDPRRLTDTAKVEKWLLRNCRWTLGRECTVEEKTDFVAYIRTQ